MKANKACLFCTMLLMSISANAQQGNNSELDKVAATPSFEVKKPELKTNSDTLAYIFGSFQTNGLLQYLKRKYNLQPNELEYFYKGILDRIAPNNNDVKKRAYNAGMEIGAKIEQDAARIAEDYYTNEEDSDKRISTEIIAKSLILALQKKNEYHNQTKDLHTFEGMLADKQRADKEHKFADNKILGERFLADNKKKNGVVTLPSGLQYKIITKGNGEIPGPRDKVSVNYEGHTVDGKEFDSSYKKDKPASIRCHQVIKGWSEALSKMPVGSKWELYIPYQLAYQDKESGDLKPYSALIFTVELLSIEEKGPTQQQLEEEAAKKEQARKARLDSIRARGEARKAAKRLQKEAGTTATAVSTKASEASTTANVNSAALEAKSKDKAKKEDKKKK